jgi:hypothetical protein
MKVDTAIEHIRVLLERAGQVNQIIIHRQPGTLGEVTIEVRRQYRNEADLGIDAHSNR